MCIIACYNYKKGIKPTKERIEEMVKRNPDGVGVAYNNGARVYFAKALTNAERVWEFLNELPRGARDVVFHARIATSGGISAEKCHPFPLTSDDDILQVRSYLTRGAVVFHNGVFSITPETGKNDTQTFIKYALSPLYKNDPEGVLAGKYDYLIEQAVKGSRVVILHAKGIKLFGANWTSDDGGVLYSNTSYKPYKPLYCYDLEDDRIYGRGYGARTWQEWRDLHTVKKQGGASEK